jgi:plasmid replication initiation protein
MNDVTNKKIKLPEVIRQPYQLTANFVKFNFSAGENRVLVRILQRIKVHQEIDYTPQIDLNGNISLQYHYRDLILDSTNTKERLDEALTGLREKTLPITSKMVVNGKEEESVKLVGVIEKPEWTKSRSHVKIDLDAGFYGFLTDLSKGYTEYLADSSFNLTGTYNIKFYYFVRQWLKSGGRTIHTLQQFRNELEIPNDKYTKNVAGAFKQKIIDPAKKMLDEIADVSFNYSDIKQGRKTIGFVFKFYQTNNKAPVRYNIERIEEIFSLLEGNFELSKADRSRLVGLTNKYQFTFLKSLINTHYFDIKDNYDRMKDLPNAINKVILDNYDYLFKKDAEVSK